MITHVSIADLSRLQTHFAQQRDRATAAGDLIGAAVLERVLQDIDRWLAALDAG